MGSLEQINTLSKVTYQRNGKNMDFEVRSHWRLILPADFILHGMTWWLAGGSAHHREQ